LRWLEAFVGRALKNFAVGIKNASRGKGSLRGVSFR
jgi:hypothetical protein